jgi:hypothetical protein
MKTDDRLTLLDIFILGLFLIVFGAIGIVHFIYETIRGK